VTLDVAERPEDLLASLRVIVAPEKPKTAVAVVVYQPADRLCDLGSIGVHAG